MQQSLLVNANTGDHMATAKRGGFGPDDNAWFGGSGTGVTFIVYGAIIVFVARFQPGGVAALWRQATARRARRAA